MKISQSVSSFLADKNFRLKITWGHNSVNNVDKLQFLFSTHHLSIFIFVTSFMKISQRVSELLDGHDFHTEIYMGHKSVNNEG